MDRLEEWRIFVTIATTRSFTKAARTLGKSPQAATRAVAALEDRLGTRLLHRTTRAVSVTSEGEHYLERAKRAISEIDLLETPDDAARGGGGNGGDLRGHVTMTAPVLFGQLHVVPMIADLLEAHPELTIRLILHDHIMSLAEEGVDVGVRIGALPDSSLRALPLGHVRSVHSASPAYLERAGKPRDPSALTKHSLISWDATTPIADRWSFRRSEAGAREQSVVVHPRLIVNTGQAAIDAALRGLGIVRTLSYQVAAHVASGDLHLVLRAFEPKPIPVQLVQLAGARGRAVTTFMEQAAERLRAAL